MTTIQASEFKAKCLALMDEISRSGEVIVITKNGYPVAELRPFSGGRRESPFGLHKGLRIQGDIISPLEDGRWEALEWSCWIRILCYGWMAMIPLWVQRHAV